MSRLVNKDPVGSITITVLHGWIHSQLVLMAGGKWQDTAREHLEAISVRLATIERQLRDRKVTSSIMWPTLLSKHGGTEAGRKGGLNHFPIWHVSTMIRGIEHNPKNKNIRCLYSMWPSYLGHRDTKSEDNVEFHTNLCFARTQL